MNWVLWQRQTTEYSLVPDPTDSLADRLIVVTGSVSFTPHRMTPVFVEKSKRHVKVAIRAIVAHHTISLQGVLYINKSLFNLVVGSSHQQGSASARQSPPAASAADFWML